MLTPLAMPSPTQDRGQRHEDLAEEALTRAGYRIEERNWRGGGGEIDRVAWDGEVIVFVEIRSLSKTDHGLPFETVRERKQRRVVAAALAYLTRFSPGSVPLVRFDVVSVVHGDGDSEIEIFRAAFDGSVACGRRSLPMV
jgi:putative endonuclease